MSDKSEACPMCGTPVDANVEEHNKAQEAKTTPPPLEPTAQQNNNETPRTKQPEAVSSENNPPTPPPPTPSKPKPEQPKKKNKTGLIIGIVAGVIVIAAVIAVFVMKSNKEQDLSEQQAEYELQMQEQQAQHEAELEEQRQQQEAQQNKLKGYEWLEGVWAGCDEYGNFGRMIVTDSYYQVVNSNMDDAFDQVEKMEKIDYELKNRPDYITGEGNGVSFGFDEYIRVDVEHHSIYIIQGEYNGIVLQKIEEDDFEAAVFEANHGCPPRVYSNAYDGYVNIRQTPQSKAPIVGVLHNGPEGAVLLGTEGEWKKIDCNGIVGYVYEKYVQDTPTEVYHGE